MADEARDIPSPGSPNSHPQVIIAGFGIPGRYLAELLTERQIPFTVIEQNPVTAARCTTIRMLAGDVRDESLLRRAGLMHAHTIAITLPNEHAVQETISIVRHLRPDIRIMARCTFTSSGFKAQQLGADIIIVAEQLVAQAFYRSFEASLVAPPPANPTQVTVDSRA